MRQKTIKRLKNYGGAGGNSSDANSNLHSLQGSRKNLKASVTVQESLVEKPPANWNALTRLVTMFQAGLEGNPMLAAFRKKGQIEVKVPVPGKNFTYSFSIGTQIPSFTFIPSKIELFQRLVTRGALKNNLDHYTLHESKI